MDIEKKPVKTLKIKMKIQMTNQNNDLGNYFFTGFKKRFAKARSLCHGKKKNYRQQIVCHLNELRIKIVRLN